MPMLEHLGLRVIEEQPTRLVGAGQRDLGAGLRRPRPDRPAAGPRALRRPRRGDDRGGLERRDGVRLAAQARHHRGARLAPRRDPARVPLLPPAHRLALHRGLPERRHRGQPARDREADGALRAALRSGRRARRGARGRAARGHPRRPRGRALARPRPHPAQPARAHRGDRAHERLQARRAVDRVQAALGRRARDPAAVADVGDLRLRPRGRGHPPARRARSRAAACGGRTAWTTAPRSSASCARR